MQEIGFCEDENENNNNNNNNLEIARNSMAFLENYKML